VNPRSMHPSPPLNVPLPLPEFQLKKKALYDQSKFKKIDINTETSS
jgi:hypothetical protein